MTNRHAAAMARLSAAILETPGETEPELRKSISSGAPADPPLGPYLDRVRRHAYKVVDADLSGLRDAGYSEDAIFELTLAAALGAAKARLDAGLAALETR